jgi:hypothetical protein
LLLVGKIPRPGEKIVFSSYEFTVLNVEDNRRIVSLLAEPHIDTNSGNDKQSSKLGLDVNEETFSHRISGYSKDRRGNGQDGKISDSILSQNENINGFSKKIMESVVIEKNNNDNTRDERERLPTLLHDKELSIEELAGNEFSEQQVEKEKTILVFRDGQWIDPAAEEEDIE